ncbi:hypothetical protein BCR44DRAFT_211503 [Catenaria anguillulae PL171]|uniref:Stress response protein NST1 n=1 Tax=Catenaria anguillulae PL171 TaxID=765915 RepID=A0A1Y2HZQ2_9FUNG|nr:hypothetical protein BCR44DRAFT_211503 [Catenaria anguillulae PL171]
MGSSKNRKEKRANHGSASSAAPASTKTQPTAASPDPPTPTPTLTPAPTNPNDPQSMHIPSLRHLPPSDLLERALSGSDPDLLARLQKVMTTHDVLKHVLAHVPEKDRVGVTAYWLTRDPRHLRALTNMASQVQFVKAARTRREAYCSSATCPQCLKEADGLIEDAKKLVARVDLTHVVRGRIESQVDNAVKAKMDADRQAKADVKAAKKAAAFAASAAATAAAKSPDAAAAAAAAAKTPTAQPAESNAVSTLSHGTRPVTDPMVALPSAHAHAALTLRMPTHRMAHRRRARQRLSPRQLQYPHRIANGGLAVSDSEPDSDDDTDADAVTADPHALLRLASDLTENHAHQFLSTMQKLTSAKANGTPAVAVLDANDQADESLLADHILSHLSPTSSAAARPLAATHFDPDADAEWLGDDDAWLACTSEVAPTAANARRLEDRGVALDWDVYGAAGLYGDAPVVAAGTKAQYPPGACVGAVNDPIAHAVAWAQAGGASTAAASITYDAKHMHMVPLGSACDLHDGNRGRNDAPRVVSAFKHSSSAPVAPAAAAPAGGHGKARRGITNNNNSNNNKHADAARAAAKRGHADAADDACCEWHHEYTSDEEDAHADHDEHDEIGASESDAGGCDHERCDESLDEEEEDDEDGCHGEHGDDDDDMDEHDDDDEEEDEEEEEEEEPGARADDVRSKSSASSALPSCATGPVPCGSNCIHHTGSTAKLCARHAKGITYPSPPASDAETSKDRPDAATYLSPASRYTLVSIACEFLAEHVQYRYRQYISERAAQQLLAEERAAEERKADAKRRRAEMHAAKKEAKRLEREAEERKERERIEAEQREREKKEKEREEKRKRQAEAKAKIEAEKLRAKEEREKKAEAERAAAEAKRQAKAAAQAAQAAVERAKAEKLEREKRENEEKERKVKEEKDRREKEERERKEKEERERKEREAAAVAAEVKSAAPTRQREASASKTSVASSAHSSRKPSVEPVPVSKHPAPSAKAAPQQQTKVAPPKPIASRASPLPHDKPVAGVPHQQQHPPPVNATPPSFGVSLPLSPGTARLQLSSSNGSSPSVSMLPIAAPVTSAVGANGLSSPVPVATTDHHEASSPTTTSTPSASSSASSSAPNTVPASHHSTLPSPVPSAIGKPPHGQQQQAQALAPHPGMSLQQQQQQQQMYPPPPAFAYQQALAMGLPMFPGGAPGGNPQQFMYNPAAAAAAAAMAAAAAAAAAASGNAGVQFGMPGMYAPQQQQQQFGRGQAPPGAIQHQQPGDGEDYGSAAPSVAGAHSDRATSQQHLGATSPNVHMPPPSLSRESSVHALPQQFQSPTAASGTKYGLGAEAWGVSPIGGSGSGSGSSNILPNMGASAATGASTSHSHHSLFDGLRLGTTSDLASTLSTTSSTGGGNVPGGVANGSNSHLPGPINTAMAAASGSASAGNLGSALLSGTSSIWSPFAASDPFDDLRSPTSATVSVNSASMAGSRFANLPGVQQAAAATASSTSPPSSANAASATASPWGPPAAIQSPPSTLSARETAASYRGLGAAALPAGLADALDMDDDMFDPFGFPSKPSAPVQSQFTLPLQQQARSAHHRQQPAAAASAGAAAGQQYQQQHAQHSYHHVQSNGWAAADAHHPHSSTGAFGYAGGTGGSRAGQQQAQYTHHSHQHHIQQPQPHQHQPYGHHQQPHPQQQYARSTNGFPPGSMFARNQQQVDSHTGGY